MESINFKYVFNDAFETFKVFETIPFEKSGLQADSNSKSIWQILNHLVNWQEHQINHLNDSKNHLNFDESNSWTKELSAKTLFDWNQKVSKFNIQINIIQQFITQLNLNSSNLVKDLKTIQDLSTHLSFHLGEMIFLARINKVYPQADEMNDFLAES